jgi:hypothetical protein
MCIMPIRTGQVSGKKSSAAAPMHANARIKNRIFFISFTVTILDKISNTAGVTHSPDNSIVIMLIAIIMSKKALSMFLLYCKLLI